MLPEGRKTCPRGGGRDGGLSLLNTICIKLSHPKTDQGSGMSTLTSSPYLFRYTLELSFSE